MRRSGPGLEPVPILSGVRDLSRSNPAATILPIVERVAPDRLGEVFWRAVDLCSRPDMDDEDHFAHSSIGFECMLMARYDRRATAILFAPMDAYLRTIVAEKRPKATLTASLFLGKACLDPRAAVELLESFSPARTLSQAEPTDEARLTLAEILGQLPDQRWKHVWKRIRGHLPLDD